MFSVKKNKQTTTDATCAAPAVPAITFQRLQVFNQLQVTLRSVDLKTGSAKVLMQLRPHASAMSVNV